MADTDTDKIILILLCIFLPPLAIYFKSRDCGLNVLISVLLLFLIWIPGVVHAFWYCFLQDS